MDDHSVQLIASNLTIAFYSGLLPREPFLGEEKRIEPYSPRQRDREPSLSPTEVHRVFLSLCDMVRANGTKSS